MQLELLMVPHLLLGLLLLPLSPSASASASAAVTHLPGFHGPLPFYLETGYVDVEEKTGTKLFYYFVESERSPGTVPVLLWLTGGPRCSGFSGFAFEVGPINFVLAPYDGHLPQLVYNPHSWSKMASIIFLDSPVGSGFSYARDPKGYDVGDMSSSLQVVTFLNKWFDEHPRYRSNAFYIGGSSYAGKIIPLIAQYISEGIEQRKQPVINLKGYLVGNPITGSRYTDSNSRIPYAHGFGIIPGQLYEAAIENCKGDYINPLNNICAGILNTIEKLLSEVDHDHILDDKCVRTAPNPVNAAAERNRFLSEEHIQQNVPSPHPTINCFSYRYYLANIWANENVTRDALRIKQGTIGEWVRCITGLPYTGDLPSSIPYHLNLSTRGYRVLVFSGDHDPGVPFLGTYEWIRSLNFSIVDDWRAWHVDGQSGGFTVAYANNITFATVKGGGHTAIRHQPKQCFAMAQRWLDNEPL
ncbi:serine carboxypeptidase-like 2 isoform X1 [Triticum dicoccoides]|uniref:serine carboxypeptidase-like 2 isoform X1 n=1 Tax=Triticum dicoccoides TaxID=85692 RepID=UPI001891E885|nr:serine carboxypeptidase-like 2 isoform X1 [Triticum dicoccoides]